MSMSIPGLGSLVDDYLGSPAVVRWLSINPDRRVVVRDTENVIAYSTRYEMWVQWRLVRDVYRLFDLASLGSDLAATLIHCGEHGVVVTARLDQGPINPVATGMLAAVGVEHEAHGTVAWLAQADPQTGLHGDLDDERIAALLALAEQSGAAPRTGTDNTH